MTEIRDGDSAFPVLVGGAAAEFVDQQEAIASRLPLAAALLVLLTFSILWLMTGSVVLPLKAIVMNALTVGSALGILTFIYQDGRLESLLGYTSNGGIEPTDFLVAAALVFALSTDYGVFLLGRIKEARAAATPSARRWPSGSSTQVRWSPRRRSSWPWRSASSRPPRSRSSSRSASPPRSGC